MSQSPESRASKSSLQLEEYRGKFPEIPEQVLVNIFQKVSLFSSLKHPSDS
jgi:hypothetical protein